MSCQLHPADEAPALEAIETLIGRRTAPRLSVRMPARFRIGDCVNEVVVGDISETGARLSMVGPPPTGMRGTLCWEEIECSCLVVWSAAGSFGVRFDAEVPTPAALVSEAKRTGASRFLTDIPVPPSSPAPLVASRGPAFPGTIERPAEIRQADRWIRVRLKAVSRQGFDIGWFPGCQDQQPIWLRGTGLPSLKGRVISSDHLTVRCRLNAPLHDAVLEHVESQLRGDRALTIRP